MVTERATAVRAPLNAIVMQHCCRSVNMNEDIESALEWFPEVGPWLARISAAKSESEILAIVVQSMSDEDLGRIGGLFYSGYASSIGATAARRAEELAASSGAA